MANEVAEVKTTEVAVNYNEKAIDYLNSMGTKLPEKHMKQFVELCSSFKLNPFAREIYAVGYGENFNIIVGYEVYIKRAERTGLLAGWHVDYNNQEKSATLTIQRKDWSAPFTHTVYDAEYNTHKSIWASKPITMLKKVAIAQGFRMCFSEDLGGMPYTSDELGEPVNITNEASARTIAKTAAFDEEYFKSLCLQLEEWQSQKEIPASWKKQIDKYVQEFNTDGLEKALKALMENN